MNIIHKVSLRVIAIFMLAIFSSFIPDTFPELFGDVKCQGYVYEGLNLVGCKIPPDNWNIPHEHGAYSHWGARHYMWAWMNFCLALIQVVSIIVMIYNHLEDESRRTKETL